MGKKNTETAESGEKERGCIFLCARMNVHDHVHLMKKAGKEDREENKENKAERKKESSLCVQSVLPKHSCACGPCASVFMLLAHLKTPHISRRALRREGGKNQLNEEEPPRQNQPVLSAPLLFKPILDGAFSSGAQAGT